MSYKSRTGCQVYGYDITIEEDSKADYTLKITGWNGVIDTPIHGVIDDETGNLCLSAYNYGDKSKFPIFPCRMGRAGL